MMIKIVIPSLLLLSGMCAYASINHLFVALRRPLERTHLLFAIMCLLMVTLTISHALALQAENIGEFISALRWNLAAPLLFFHFFLWFIALYTGKRLLPLIVVGLHALFAVLFVANLTLPYTIQYDRLDGIRALHLPWGEAVTLGVGHNGLWAHITIAGVLMAFGYALYALGGLYRRDRRKTSLCMMLAIGLFIVSSIQGILVRLSAIDFIHLGPFGFLTVVLVMSATLTYETRQRLRNSERRFRSLVEQSPFSIQMLAPDGRTRQVNQAWEKLWGVKSDVLADYNILQDKQLIDKGVMPYVENGLAGKASEIPPIVYNPADNPVVRGPVCDRWVRAYIYPIKDADGTVREVILMHEDITERKRADEERAFLANITEHATDAIEGIDLDTNIVSWNRGAEILFGYHAEEAIGKPHSLIVPKEAQEACRERFKKATLEGFVRAVTERIKKDGGQFLAEMTLTALKDGNGDHTGFVCITHDITERRKLEEQLRHAQKMEAIGQLAGGIAHDFNNILSAIMGFGSLVEMNMKEDDPNKDHVKEVLKAGKRATHLTQSLLAFSRKQIIDLKPQNLNEIIKDVERFLRRIIGEDIKLKTRASAKDLTILADRGQIEQVLMNLATNSRDAMPEGGELTIETAIIQIDKEYIKKHTYGETGMYALLSVTDSGMGMDEKTRQKIFEPFFTTKEMGRGTGLGLAMIYGIVKQHDGYIDVYSVPEKGTTFRIYLPLINLEAKEKATAAPTVYPKGGTETVLVAEDDEAVRKITNNILERFGYKVISAVDGEDAIRKFRENKDEIKLLLLDVIMPKKNGKEAYEEIRKIKPDIKTIFLSGYMADLMDKKGILKEGLNFIMKPASPKELLKKVREALDSLHPSAS